MLHNMKVSLPKKNNGAMTWLHHLNTTSVINHLGITQGSPINLTKTGFISTFIGKIPYMQM